MSARSCRAPGPGLIVLLLCALVAGLVLPAAVAAPASASVEERRLRQAQQRLAEVRERVGGVTADRDRQAEALADVSRQLEIAVEAVNQAEMAVQRQQEAVEAARRKLASLQEQGREHRQVMTNRAVTLYRQGTTASWVALLSADDAEDALQRSVYVEVVSRADRELFERVGADRVRTDAQRATLEAEEAALERVLAQQREMHAEIEALHQERAVQLAGLEDQLASLRSEERHLESESRELAAMVRRSSQARQAAAARSASSRGQAADTRPASAGGWTWPASGRVTSRFGMRWGRMHEGVDIGAPQGAAVVAARDGRVTFSGRMGGYGNLVLVDHGGGVVTAYAHLSAFAARSGQRVSAGQRIGSVGCTGSCTGPHLHFEVRVNGAARNPLGYLP